MRVVVCIKPVPVVDQLKFDTQAGRLIRDGVESEINPFDKRALAEAINLKYRSGAETVAITMGPPQAQSALREALAMGIDRAVHLNGRQFAGADTLATARALALALNKIGFDLVLCGKYSTDAETAQVPGMVAEMLDIPQITGVTRVEYRDRTFSVTRETDEGFETFEGQLPALFSAAERLAKPIKVAPKDLERFKDAPIETLTAADLSADPSLFGMSGSPTWVEQIYSIAVNRKCIVRPADGNLDRAVQETVDDLLALGLFGKWKGHERELVAPHPPRRRYKSIWTVAELAGDAVRHVTYELLGSSIQLADKLDAEVGVVLMGTNADRFVDELAAHGADRILIADSPALADYQTEPYAQVLTRAIKAYNPWAVLIPSTANGRDLAPRVAARLGVGLTGDCIGLQVDEQGRLVQLQPAFGGNIVAPILTRTSPVMATIRPGLTEISAVEPGRKAEIVRLPVENLSSRLRLVGVEVKTEQAVNMDDVDVIIGVGMGVGGPENLPVVEELASTLNASIGATRRVVDAGWLPRQVQIGLSGRTVSPPLYLALGVRGAFNHMVGVQRSGVILAINNNPEADILHQCDFGLIGDWQDTARELIRVLKESKQAREQAAD